MQYYWSKSYILGNTIPGSFWLLIFLCSSFSGLTQSDTLKPVGGAGEFYIINWSPSGEQDGALISEVILDYEYGIKNETPKQQFQLSWQIGDNVVVDGETYSRSELGEDVFSKLQVKKISFTSRVYSDGQYICDLDILYPDIIPRSGGESSWYIFGGPSWEELFVGVSPKQAREIYDRGFQLKNPQILDIQFDGMDAVKQRIKELKGLAGSTEQASPKEKRSLRTSRLGMFFMDFDASQKRSYRGLPWHISLSPALSFHFFQGNLNEFTTETDTATGAIDTSTATIRDGIVSIGLSGSAEAWLLYGENAGLGAFAAGMVGGSFNTQGFDLGLKFYLGAKRVKFLGQYSLGQRFGKLDKRNTKITADGSISNLETLDINQALSRYGLGTRIWLGKHKFSELDVMLFFDRLFIDNIVQWASIIQIRFWLPAGFEFVIERGSQYPALGEVLYDTDPATYTNKGGYFALRVAKTFNFFAEPSVLDRFRVKKRRRWK